MLTEVVDTFDREFPEDDVDAVCISVWLASAIGLAIAQHAGDAPAEMTVMEFEDQGFAEENAEAWAVLRQLVALGVVRRDDFDLDPLLNAVRHVAADPAP